MNTSLSRFNAAQFVSWPITLRVNSASDYEDIKHLKTMFYVPYGHGFEYYSSNSAHVEVGHYACSPIEPGSDAIVSIKAGGETYRTMRFRVAPAEEGHHEYGDTLNPILVNSVEDLESLRVAVNTKVAYQIVA